MHEVNTAVYFIEESYPETNYYYGPFSSYELAEHYKGINEKNNHDAVYSISALPIIDNFDKPAKCIHHEIKSQF